MAITDQTAAPIKGPSLILQLAVLLVVTAAAVGGGWFAGGYLGKESSQEGVAETAHAPAQDHGAPAAAAGGHGEETEADPLLVSLAPMTTNLAAPSRVWVRMELTLLLDAAQSSDMIEAIHQDLFAYMRTLKLHQIEGASGYQHLKSDLEERARIRSDGHVKQVLIRTLLFE
ncbi:flagellar basal body-associated FliL family protein [Mesorhizobium sp. ASY16-5R]|uniref:flagellar basal body-associated FliL family protein n=1 Tax=Mesorhizobium sp. ASY16-5R TaxID=3445772 RepID=UPI003FA0DEC1